jgi:hypothetical protein
LREPIHKLTNRQLREDMTVSNTPLVYTQIVIGSQGFLLEVFRVKFFCFITILYLLFSIIKQDEFRDLMLYSSPYLRHDDSLLKNSISILTSLVISFLVCQAILIVLFQKYNILIYLFLDFWISSNKYAFLGVIGYFVNY